MCQLCKQFGLDYPEVVHTPETNPFSVGGTVTAAFPDAAPLPESSPNIGPPADYATVVGVTPSDDDYINALLWGAGQWTGTINYSFPSALNPPAYAVAITDFVQVSATQISATQGILEGIGNRYGSFESVCGASVSQVADNTVQSATNLLIAECGDFDGANLDTARVADFPGASFFPAYPDAQGDVWFGNDNNFQYRNPVLGDYAWLTHIHEYGHAFGLKHAHSNVGSSAPLNIALPTERDAMEFSVMSYRSYIGGPDNTGYSNETYGYAQTLMMYDILALQYMYGANYNTNSGDTTYSWSSTTGQMFVNGVGQTTPGANRVFLTIWDGGGNDTYDMSNYVDPVTIDLRPEQWSITSETQRADLDTNSLDPTRIALGTVYNAALFNGDTASLIENAIGANFADSITGNQAGNALLGNGGDDVIHGLEGNDYLRGDAGADSLYGEDGNDTLEGGNDADYLGGGVGTDSIYAGAGNDVMQGGDDADYLDGSSGADTMYGENGNDVLDGGANLSSDADFMDGGDGNDTLYARGGNDTLRGGTGFDALYGDAGADYLFGGEGNDYLGGQGDGDFMQAGNGDDSMDGGDTADYMEGEAGADSLYGGDGGDVMHGGDDADYLAGQNNGDTMYGEAGSDVLDGGTDGSSDYLEGGTGSDSYIFGVGMGNDVVGTFDDGGSEDLIYISSTIVSNFATLQTFMSQFGADVIVNLGASGRIQINNVTLGNLGADDFVFF